MIRECLSIDGWCPDVASEIGGSGGIGGIDPRTDEQWSNGGSQRTGDMKGLSGANTVDPEGDAVIGDRGDEVVPCLE